MSRPIALLLAFSAGLGAAVQAPVNAALGRDIGRLQAATVSFGAGMILLLVLVFAVGGGFGRIGSHPVGWHYVAGGVIGAVYVTVSLAAVRTLGVAGLTAAVIAGQLGMSVILDRFGWLGVERIPLHPERLVGLGLLTAGTWLVLRR